MSTSIARAVRKDAHQLALATLHDQDPARAEQAAARVGNAFAAAVATSKNASAWRNVSPQSVSAAVATSIHTDLYPGGPMPTVYLVPQSGELQWRITHRGLCELCRRDGYDVRAVPVARDDVLEVSAGLVTLHEQDPDAHPASLAGLRGVLVEVRRADGTAEPVRHWVPMAVIEQRRQTSRMASKGPWKDWPIEMAQKTAILYLGARGSLPVSSSMQRAMEAEVIHVERTMPPRQVRALPVAEPIVPHIEADAEEVSDGE